jgi:DNA-binding CsgD family transcriptional regulator
MTRYLPGTTERLLKHQLATIDAIYGAVADPSRWIEVAKAASALVGGGVSAIMYRSGDRLVQQRLLATDMDPAFAAKYEQYYGGVCPWVLKTPRNRPTLQLNDQMLASSDEMEHSEFNAEWLRPQNIRHSFDASIQVGSDRAIDLAAIRSRRLGPFDELEGRAILELVPHLRRAVELSNRLGFAELSGAASILASQRLGTGVLIVDADRRVVSADAEGERILSGGALTIRNGQLRAPHELDMHLGQAIARATGCGRISAGRQGSLFGVPRPNSLPLSVAVGPIDERDRPLGLAGPLAMVLITDPERQSGPSEEGLRALYDLTQAEARLVVAICAGETLASYAAAAGTSLNTVKTHLKHVFEKTGETRQADLVRRVTNDVVLRVGS